MGNANIPGEPKPQPTPKAIVRRFADGESIPFIAADLRKHLGGSLSFHESHVVEVLREWINRTDLARKK